ncbi:hypothetical protein [Planktothrix phage Pra-JY27]|nr:needle head protein [Planktothrix phage Pag-Yong1]WEV89207.1 constituent protein [Synechococcus phage MinM2]
MLKPYPLRIPPGIVTDATRYSARGRYVGADKIRFRNGFPESIGGWVRAIPAKLDGVCRSIYPFTTLGGGRNAAFGTHKRAYVWWRANELYDITPLVIDATLGTDPISTEDGSNRVGVDFGLLAVSVANAIIISGATAVGGISAGLINGEHEIVEIVGTVAYFEVDAEATSTATGGGAAVEFQALYPIGPVDSVSAGSWGAGSWGQGPWGGDTSGGSGLILVPLRRWSFTSWGEDLLTCPQDGPIFYWQDNAPSTRAEAIADMMGASQVPVAARQVCLLTDARIVVAFGVNPIGGSDQDPLLVRWSDNENFLEWDPTVSGSSAGELHFSSGSAFITAIQAPSEILAWTDTALFSVRSTGGADIVGITLITPNAQIAGQFAATIAGDAVFWFGPHGFFRYAGAVQRLECPVEDRVRRLLNDFRIAKTFASANATFNEVQWHFVSEDSPDGEPDAYVKFNYIENVWDVGTMSRSAWADRGIFTHPLAVRPDGRVVFHEIGTDDAAEDVPAAIPSFIETGPIEIDDSGYYFIAVREIIPDALFLPQAGPPQGTLNMTLRFDRTPGGGVAHEEAGGAEADGTGGPSPTAVAITPHTQTIRRRGRGRSVALRVDGGLAPGYGWRLGVQRLVGRPDGRK